MHNTVPKMQNDKTETTNRGVFIQRSAGVGTVTGLQTHIGLSRGLAAILLGAMLLPTSLSAEVIWMDAENVVTSPELDLAFNNTKVAVRDGEGVLHLVWRDGNDLRYGHQEESGSWTIQLLATPGAGTVFKPTITLVGGGTLLISWSEQVGPDQQRVAFTTSEDSGANWSTPSWVSPPGVDARSVSLSVSEGAAGGNPFAAISWHDSANATVNVSTWTNTSGWTTPQNPIDASGSAKDAAIAAQGQTLILVWEDDRSGETQIRYAVSHDSGANWGSDTLLGVDWGGALNSQGGDPSIAFGPDGEILIGYQHRQSVFLVQSDDGGSTFSNLHDVGDGLFIHLDIAPNGSAFAAWEEFQGGLFEPGIKRFGSAFSTDVFATYDGPFFVPGSDLEYGPAYPAGIINDQWLDIFWIDHTGDTPVLWHRAAALVVPGSPDIAINEWMASNQSTLADPADGRFEDWLELYNAGSEPVDLAGYTLTNDLNLPSRWTFPVDTIIEPDGYLLIWLDGDLAQQDPAQGQWHASFSLNSAGGCIGLFTPEGVRVDAVEFGPQGTDLSVGRTPDGVRTQPVCLASPTPGKANRSECPFRILEITLSSPQRVRLTWRSAPGELYVVEQSERMESASWTDVSELVTAEGWSTTTEVGRLENQSAAYFRLKIVTP